MNDVAASHARNEAAVVKAPAVPDREAEGLALLGLSRSDLSAGDAAHARERAAASRRLLRPLGAEWGQAPLHMLAQAARLTGALDEASTLFEESLALNRSLGDAGMVVVELHNLGRRVAARQGRRCGEGFRGKRRCSRPQRSLRRRAYAVQPGVS